MGSCCYEVGTDKCKCAEPTLPFIVESANKPGSFLMAQREAFYAGFDMGTAYADGYIPEGDTKFELWYAKQFMKGIGGTA